MHLVGQSIYLLLGGEPPQPARRTSRASADPGDEPPDEMQQMVSMLPQTPFQMPCRTLGGPDET